MYFLFVSLSTFFMRKFFELSDLYVPRVSTRLPPFSDLPPFLIYFLIYFPYTSHLTLPRALTHFLHVYGRKIASSLNQGSVYSAASTGQVVSTFKTIGSVLPFSRDIRGISRPV